MSTPDPSFVCQLCGGRPTAMVAAEWTLTIPNELPSQNQVAVNKGHGRHRYRAVRQAFNHAIAVTAKQQRIPNATSLRRVLVKRLWKKRQRAYDHGNLIGGAKSAIDTLVGCGLLLDDSPKWAELHYSQERDPTGVGCTIITIQELHDSVF